MMTFLRFVRRVLVLGLIPTTASLAQVCPPHTILQQLDGPPLLALFGYSVAAAGDVDADGVPDVLVGAPLDESQAGAGYVFSGRDGHLLHRFVGTQPGRGYGRAAASAGDIDGDGHDDVMFGAPMTDVGTIIRAGSAFVYSGRDGTLLLQFDGSGAEDLLGSSLASVSDVNADGIPDLAVGAAGASLSNRSRTGYAHIYSGRDGSLVRRHEGTDADDAFGCAVDGVGDWNGDGVPDYAIGARYASSLTTAHVGSVFVYSGSGGAQLARFDGTATGDFFGVSLAGASDVDADGVPDLVVGASLARPGGLVNAGSVFVHSGHDGRLLHRVDGPERAQLGWSVDGAGDVDGDGFADVIAGMASPPATGSGVQVFSGRDGSQRLFLDASSLHAVAGVGDVNGDGLSDVTAAFPTAPTQLPYAVIFGALTSRTYGTGLPGTLGVPQLTLEHIARIGALYELRASNSLGTPTPAALVLGPTAVSVPILGGTLLVDPVIVLTVNVPANGGIVLSAPIPPDTALVCASAFQQAITLDPGAVQGLSFTPGLEVILWP